MTAASDLSSLRDEGFTAIQSYDTAPEKVLQLDAAARRTNLTLVISPLGMMSKGLAAPRSPAITWYLQDEPDVNGVSPEQLRERERKVGDWSPGAKTTFVVGDGRRAKDYVGIADAIMVDWYPVPHLPLESLGDHVRLTAESAGARPVWAVIQAFDWKDYVRRADGKPPVGRFPDIAEIRFMSYDAVLNGAQGLWYFTFTCPGGKPLSDYPELWFAVTHVSRELAAMKHIFAYGKPIPLPFPPNPDGVAAHAWRYHGRDYVVIANRRNGYEMRVPESLLQPRWRPLFEVRRDPRELLDHVGAAYYLTSYRVMVFESRLNALSWFSL